MRLRFNFTAVSRGILLLSGASCISKAHGLEASENAKRSLRADNAKNVLFQSFPWDDGSQGTNRDKAASSSNDSGGWCNRDVDCDSGRCDWPDGCLDKLPVGEPCNEFSDCETNYCKDYSTCAPKEAGGSPCPNSDACLSGYCRGSICVDMDTIMCDTPLTIPFMITDVEGNHLDGDRLFIYDESLAGPVDIYFLKDVQFCEEGPFDETHPLDVMSWTIVGTKISSDEFKNEVENYLATSDANEVLNTFHGWDFEGALVFMEAYNFNRDHMSTTGYLNIPYIWMNFGSQPKPNFANGGVIYKTDYNINAIKAGKLIAQHLSVFETSYTSSLMAYGMGTWVLRILAQIISPSQPLFKNIFMVAADARSDLFSIDFNPSAPVGSDYSSIKTKRSLVKEGNLLFPIAEEEFLPNGGYQITQLCNHAHVFWNMGDGELDTRETFGMLRAVEVSRPLGKYGDSVDYASETSDYFKEHVTYHDFTAILEGGVGPIETHEYQFSQEAIDIYVANK